MKNNFSIFDDIFDNCYGCLIPAALDTSRKIVRVILDRTDTAMEFKFYVPGVKSDEIKVKTEDKKLFVSVKVGDNDETQYIDLRPYAESDTKAIGFKPSSVKLSLGILTIKFDYVVKEEDKAEEYKINEEN